MSQKIKRQGTLNLAFILLGQSLLRAVCPVLVAVVRVRIKVMTQTQNELVSALLNVFSLSQQGLFLHFHDRKKYGKWKLAYGKMFMFPRRLTLLYFLNIK